MGRRVIECVVCRERKEIFAVLMCKACYQKEYAKNNREKIRGAVRKSRLKRQGKLKEAEFEKFTTLQVFEKSGGVCGICDEPVDMKLKWPNPLSASVDHIVPVNKGGGHTLENVQIAHLRCNCTKRDREGFTLEK